MSRRRNRRPQPTTDKRSPEERLEALVREPNRDRADRMLIRIRDDLDVQLEPAPWIAAARVLSERLVISEDSFLYLAELLSESLVFQASQTDPELCRLRDEMDVIERAHGLRADEYWRVDDAPEDWRALNGEWERRADEITALYWRTSGHADIAAIREQNRAEFDERTNKGRIDIWGEDDEDADPSPTD